MESNTQNSPVHTGWYYVDANGQSCGPVTADELQRLVTVGTVTPETLVAKEGDAAWRKFSEVDLDILPPPPPISENSPRWPVILALVVFFPIGLLLLWRSKAFSKKLKKAITAAVLAIFIIWAFDGRPFSIAVVFGGPIAAWLLWKGKLEKRKKWIGIAGVVLLVLVVLTLDARMTGNKHGAFKSKSSTISGVCKTSDFNYVFSYREDFGGDATFSNLSQFVEGLYIGNISLKEGKRFAFRDEAVDAHVTQITEDFVIYSVQNYRLEYRGTRWFFAVPRDKKLEGNDSEKDELRDTYNNAFAFDSKRAIVLAGFQQFTTVSGLVKKMPVFETVFVTD